MLVLGLMLSTTFSLFLLTDGARGAEEYPESKGTGGNNPNWIPITSGLPTVSEFYGVTSGDVNNDGQLDIAAVRADSTMHVYVNDGLGNFAEQSNGLPGGGIAFDVVLADFNNDGNLDLGGDGIYLGNGGAGGSMTWTYDSNPENWWAVAAADVNLDGNMDIVAGTSDGVEVWTSDGGNPIVWTDSSIGLPNAPTAYGVYVGDIDHDGMPDIVSASDGGGIQAFTGNGQTGPSSLWTDVSAGSGLPNSGSYMNVDMGDIDHDGNLDIVSTSYYPPANGVRAWLGNGGAGGPMAWTEASTGLDTVTNSYIGISLKDIDNDGNLDIFAGHYNMGLRVWYSDGGAGGSVDWILNTTGLPGGQYVDVDAGDYNLDGKIDFVVSKNPGIEIWTNERPDFSINGYSSISTGLPTSGNWYDIVFGDINNDGKLDLAVSSENNQGVRVFTGDGTGTWTSASTGLPTTETYNGLRFADVDHNGTLDLVGSMDSVGGTAVKVWYGDGAGSWTETSLPSPPDTGAGVEVLDVNHDGNLDIITCNYLANQNVYVFLGDGAGGWGPNTGPSETNGYDDVALGDVNHDGNLDLIATSMTGAVETRFWLGNGTGTEWTLQTPGIQTNGVYLGAALEDLNHDGNLDVGLAAFVGASVMNVYTSDGGAGGTVDWTDESVGLPVANGYSGLEFGDLDIDGDLDIVFANQNPGNGIEVRTGNGGAGGSMLWLDASQPSLPTTGAYWGIALGDVDNDGKLEIGATRNGGVEVWKLDLGASSNQPPTLTDEDVLPQVGSVNAQFTYNVTYRDLENQAPAPAPFVRIAKGGIPWGSSPYQMLPQNWIGLPGDYTAGRNYSFTVALTDCGEDFEFSFNASDGTSEASTSAIPEPLVKCQPESRALGVQGFLDVSPGIGHVTNHTPLLNWTFFDPDFGDNQLFFNASVWDDAMSTLLWYRNATSSSNNVTYNSTGTAIADLQDGNDYWFNVTTSDGYAWSNWTNVMFHMNTPPPIPAEPINPHYIEVLAGAVSLSWTSGGADAEGDSVTYNWQLATDPLFASVVDSGSTASTTADVTTLLSTPYYWRVNATDGWETSLYGNATNGYWNFTTLGVINAEPEALNLSVQGFLQGNPLKMNLTNHSPDLGWTFYDPDILDTQQQYEVEVWTGSSGTGTNMWDPPVGFGAATSVPYIGSALIDGVTYYFRVRVNDGTTWSQWNETIFHMNALPSAPTPSSPLGGAVGLPYGTQAIAWSPVVDLEGSSVSYYWYASTDASFVSIYDNGTTSSTGGSFTTLEATKYYWRVQAHDGYEFGSNSTTSNFTTNRPPSLDWTGETNYENDGVSPNDGNTTATFEFRVEYTDLDNQLGNVKLVVLNLAGEVSNATMADVDAGDSDYSDGKLYTRNMQLDAGVYSYFFYATDTIGAIAVTSKNSLTVSNVTGTIRGTVTKDGGVPLQGAKVELMVDDQVIETIYSDGQGNFEFTEIEFGIYGISISNEGYIGHTEAASLDQTLLVLDPIQLAETEGDFAFPWWLIIAIVVVISILILILIYRRKKRETGEEEAADEQIETEEDSIDQDNNVS
jgi:hypothetical protein